MTRIRTVLFVLLLIAVVAANVLVIAPEFWSTRLWEDEAYNLTVPLNLLAGHGYTSDGILAPSHTLDPFDAHISTGPVVLLPVAGMLATGIDMVIGARLVMLLFYVALLIGLWLIGRRIAGRWGALAAVAVPVCLNTNQLPSPIQGPVDVLGEIPAAALLVFAFLAVRRRPWLAGLLLGLAVQTKLISALAAPALVLMVLPSLASAGALPRPAGASRIWLAFRRLWPLVVAALAPTVLFALVQLVSLGPAGFKSSVRDYYYFLKGGGQVGFNVAPLDKAVSLFASWFVPTGLVLAICVLAVLVGVICWRMLARAGVGGRAPDELVLAAGARTSGREVLLLLGGAALTLVLWSGWWLASAHTPGWVRYAVTALLVCVPVLAAGVVLGVRMLWLSRSSTSRPGVPGAVWTRGLAAVTVVALVGVFGAQAWLHAVDAQRPNLGETLGEQRAASASIAKLTEPRLVSQWGPQIGVIVLAGAHVVSIKYPDRGVTPIVLWNYDQSDASVAQFDALIAKTCGHVQLRLAHYAVCAPAAG